jgi:hypothetical protein
MIHRRKAFTEDILPRHFNKASKFSSFTRKLNRWGFVRLSKAPEAGAYFHPLFQRDNHKLLSQMSCQSATNTSSKNAPSSSFHEEYYRLTENSADSRGEATVVSQSSPASLASTMKEQKTRAHLPLKLLEMEDFLFQQRQTQARIQASAEQQLKLRQQLNHQLQQELIQTELARFAAFLCGSTTPPDGGKNLGSDTPPDGGGQVLVLHRVRDRASKNYHIFSVSAGRGEGNTLKKDRLVCPSSNTPLNLPPF